MGPVPKSKSVTSVLLTTPQWPFVSKNAPRRERQREDEEEGSPTVQAHPGAHSSRARRRVLASSRALRGAQDPVASGGVLDADMPEGLLDDRRVLVLGLGHEREAPSDPEKRV